VSILQVPISALQDELKLNRSKSVYVLGACAALLVIACMVSFGAVEFFTSFLNYGGKTNSFFDLVYDVFYETILPLNGFIVCLFVMYRWRKSNLNDELSVGDEAYKGSFTQKYVNFALSTFVPAILLFVFISTVLLKFVKPNALAAFHDALLIAFPIAIFNTGSFVVLLFTFS